MAKYFVSYQFRMHDGGPAGRGNCDIDLPLISGPETIREVEELVKNQISSYSVLVTGWQKFEEVKPDTPEDGWDPAVFGCAVAGYTSASGGASPAIESIKAIRAETGWEFMVSKQWYDRWRIAIETVSRERSKK